MLRASGDSYCGLYALHAALHALDIRPQLDELIVAENLSGRIGSTAEDLVRVAQQHGASAEFRSDMTLSDLRCVSTPVVLHTAVAVSRSTFQHWVLFLGMDEDSIRIYDPPRGMYYATPAELLSYWDRHGVVIGQSNRFEVAGLWNPELVLAFALVVTLLVVVVKIPFLSRSSLGALIVSSALSALMWHVLVDYGFMRDRRGTAIVASRHMELTLPELESWQVDDLLHSQGVSVVDARTASDFKKAHLPGAVNVPITVTHGELRDALAKIPEVNRVVVYCQSPKCLWSDEIARQFAARGYGRVFIFRGGMEAWQEANTGIKRVIR